MVDEVLVVYNLAHVVVVVLLVVVVAVAVVVYNLQNDVGVVVYSLAHVVVVLVVIFVVFVLVLVLVVYNTVHVVAVLVVYLDLADFIEVVGCGSPFAMPKRRTTMPSSFLTPWVTPIKHFAPSAMPK